MSLKTRSLVFATFFGNCLVVGLLVASLTTENWINAEGKRTNSTQSSAKIKFGLFTGHKSINSGYGVRNNTIDGKTRKKNLLFSLFLHSNLFFSGTINT